MATRRDVVLRRMADLGWLEVEHAQGLLGAPIEVRTGVVDRKRARYAQDAVAHEALRRFSVGELADTGYTAGTDAEWLGKRSPLGISGPSPQSISASR